MDGSAHFVVTNTENESSEQKDYYAWSRNIKREIGYGIIRIIVGCISEYFWEVEKWRKLL